ncbi:MAG: SAM-dependent methyltransferase [Negativicutes bacterium]|jgi:hypothetical protein
MSRNRLAEVLSAVVDGQIFNKIVFSKPVNSNYRKTEARLFLNKQQPFIQLTHYLTDNKAIHENLTLKNAVGRFIGLLSDDYHNCVIMTNSGNCDIKIFDSGKLVITNKISAAVSVQPAAHDASKYDYISGHPNSVSILRGLNLADEHGDLLPSRRHKFNQANKFIEVLAGMVTAENFKKRLNIVDLCCGKAYLSILAHNFFLSQNYAVNTIGVDLKPDVVQTCKAIVAKAQLKQIDFVHGDINTFNSPWSGVDVTMSLHACNVATDMVLFNALRWKSKIILCSPCCHHELAHSFDSRYLPEIAQYPLLKQRLCELATDAVRANILKAFGYTVQIIEFVDKEDSHKNSLIKAVRNNQSVNLESISCELKKTDEYCDLLGGKLTLRKLVEELLPLMENN